MTHLKRQNYFVKIEISQTPPYNMQRLTFQHMAHAFYINR